MVSVWGWPSRGEGAGELSSCSSTSNAELDRVPPIRLARPPAKSIRSFHPLSSIHPPGCLSTVMASSSQKATTYKYCGQWFVPRLSSLLSPALPSSSSLGPT